MSQTQRAGNIVLLPKSGDPLDPNRRTITLLNLDYKILAKALGNRLANVMPDIVLSRLTLCESFGLNSVFIRWFSLLYKDVTSMVTVNGFTSGPSPVRRGVRQGCPLSPLLCILFSETLSTSLDRCLGFRPFNVPVGLELNACNMPMTSLVLCRTSSPSSLYRRFWPPSKRLWCQT
ncbi:exonuclease-endonuclease-phosphatase domain superfamily [Apostichopus japonicus]|uniref:Exonuclease-endonuclease-phosphatase domain superfamily n=1 Tax=Stichopus japonicus TaxID=307972 RepID=A0A2G8L6E7_STIJA|nr:exonuclease-endonuclease-phosphatase domain superfamily [Apostichopus japonicus]